jgi:hypothetical protein
MADDVMKVIIKLLSVIINNEVQQDQWMKGYNHAFDMSPLEMVNLGREEEVIRYLMYQIEGPY